VPERVAAHMREGIYRGCLDAVCDELDGVDEKHASGHFSNNPS